MLKAMRARVLITLKKSVLDPQGKTVKHALESLNFKGVKDVRVGKMIEVALEPGIDRAAAEQELAKMSDQLFANPVIEDYRVEFEA